MVYFLLKLDKDQNIVLHVNSVGVKHKSKTVMICKCCLDKMGGKKQIVSTTDKLLLGESIRTYISKHC